MPTTISAPPIGHWELPEHFTVNVLNTAGRYPCTARRLTLGGRRLIAELSEYVKPESCIRIDCLDGFLMGELLGCWREGSTIVGAIELQQFVANLQKMPYLHMVAA